MKFILILQKNEGIPCFDDAFLSSVDAPSLIAKDFFKKQISNFHLYLYTNNQVYEETEGLFYKFTDDDIYFFNGLVAIHGNDKIPYIDEVFDAIDNNQLILGDFQAIHLDSKDNAFIKTSQSSIFPMFYFENEDCFVLSNELKLIVDGINCFRTNFVNNYDYKYMEDIYYKGFFYKKPDKDFRRTIFKDIKRILPHDEISIKNGTVEISQNSDIEVPKWFEDWYLEDKDSLYDWYYDSLIDYTDSFLNHISKNTELIQMSLTGGLDSRVTISVLERLYQKYDIEIETHTSGLPDHPDVILAEKVANALDLPWNNPRMADKMQLKRTPQTFQEYASTFYESQGDFDSHNFVTFYSRPIRNSSSFGQTGRDVYKRDSMFSIMNFNLWSSRRILFQMQFYFPVLSTNFELWFSRIYDKYHKGEKQYKEFVYNVLKRSNPELLEIPFAFDSLPQVDVEPFAPKEYANTEHRLQPFLWDYQFVYNELNPVLKTEFDEVDSKNDSVLSNAGLNSLDYFLLKDKISKILDKSKDVNDCKKKLISLKKKSFYSKNRVFVDLEKAKSIDRVRSLLKLMDWASAASFDSFYSLEKYANFNGENHVYDPKEKIYEDYELLNEKSKKSDKKIKELKKENKEIKDSNSWKLTKPLRKVTNKVKK